MSRTRRRSDNFHVNLINLSILKDFHFRTGSHIERFKLWKELYDNNYYKSISHNGVFGKSHIDGKVKIVPSWMKRELNNADN